MKNNEERYVERFELMSLRSNVGLIDCSAAPTAKFYYSNEPSKVEELYSGYMHKSPAFSGITKGKVCLLLYLSKKMKYPLSVQPIIYIATVDPNEKYNRKCNNDAFPYSGTK